MTVGLAYAATNMQRRRSIEPGLAFVTGMCANPMDDRMVRMVKGYEFASERNMEGLDKGRIKNLIERSFGKRLVDGYLDHNDFTGVILEKDFKSIAIVRGIEGIPYSYLCKLATEPAYQGNGVGKAVWELLTVQHPAFMWRATKSNPINGWYEAKSQGRAPHGDWVVYWHGIQAADAMPYVQGIGQLPKTLTKPAEMPATFA